jgi:hypothetical protein
MSTRNQIILATALVVVAVSVVMFQMRGSEGGQAEAAADGHDHAAMLAAAGGEAQPVILDEEGARRIGVQPVVGESEDRGLGGTALRRLHRGARPSR